MSKVIGTTLAVVGGAVVFVWPLAVWLQVKVLEKPKYKLLKTLGKTRLGFPAVELRQYEPTLVAEVTVEGEDIHAATGKGFRQVAGFIFGKNKAVGEGEGSSTISMTSPVVTKISAKEGDSAAKIAMTSPVVTNFSNGKYQVSFVMPSKYTKDTLPKPENPDVIIKEVPGATLAALSWRGTSPDQATVLKKKAELLELLKKEDVTVADEEDVILYQYYPPWTPPFLKLQEVLLRVQL